MNDQFLAFVEDVAYGEPTLVTVPAVPRWALVGGAGDFLEGQEAVAPGAEFDECRFETRFDSRYASLVDVSLLLLIGTVFDVEVVELLTVDQGDSDLFRLSRVDEHAFHGCFSVS